MAPRSGGPGAGPRERHCRAPRRRPVPWGPVKFFASQAGLCEYNVLANSSCERQRKDPPVMLKTPGKHFGKHMRNVVGVGLLLGGLTFAVTTGSGCDDSSGNCGPARHRRQGRTRWLQHGRPGGNAGGRLGQRGRTPGQRRRAATPVAPRASAAGGTRTQAELGGGASAARAAAPRRCWGRRARWRGRLAALGGRGGI